MTLVLGIPESHLSSLRAIDNKPYLDMGRVTVRVDGLNTSDQKGGPPHRTLQHRIIILMRRRKANGAAIMTNTMIPISQINLHRSKDAAAVLAKRMATGRTWISLIQEPWTVRGSVKGVGQGCCMIADASGERPRACIALKGVSGVPLLQFCYRDLAAVSCKVNSDQGEITIVFASAYFPHEDSEVPPVGVQRLVEHCKLEGLPLIIGCDANAHNTVWGSTDTNVRGENLITYLAGSDMDVANVGSEPTFRNICRGEVLDLTLVSLNIRQMIHGWNVSDEPSLSDHATIVFWLRCSTENGLRDIHIPRSTDWVGYLQELERDLRVFPKRIGTVSGLDDATVLLSGIVTGAYLRSSKARVVDRKSKVPWWNGRLETMKNKVRLAYQKARSARGERKEELFSKWRKERNDYRMEIRSAKKASWKNYCEKIETGREAARLGKVLASNPSAWIGAIKLPDGTYTTNDEDTLTHLIKANFPDGRSANEESTTEEKGNYPQMGRNSDYKFANEVVNWNKLEWALDCLEPYKSPGLDGIFPALLTKGKKLLMKPLLAIYRASLALGHVPECWKVARVTFIPKPGKPSYVTAKDFRPISLTSFLLKTLERLIQRYIIEKLERSSPLSKDQHAYIQGRSTDSALHGAVSLIEDQIEQGGYVIGLLLDIEGAFNHTSTDIICAEAEKRGIHPLCTQWIRSMLHDRRLVVEKGLTKVEMKVDRGCPQGGVLSPLLWLLVVDSLLVKLKGLKFSVTGYADDILILVRGPFLDTLRDRAQKAISVVEEWCGKTNLSVNATKTECIIFTRKYKIMEIRPLRMFGVELTVTKEVKYLGIILDSRLNWNSQVQRICTNFWSALWLCRRAVGCTWGLSPKTILWILKAILLPRLTYGSVVWWNAIKKGNVKSKLERLRSNVLRVIASAMRTTPTAAMGVLTGVAPFDLLIMGRTYVTAHRLFSNDTWSHKGNHAKGLRTMCSLKPLGPADTIRHLCFEKRFRISLSTGQVSYDANLAELPPNGDIWYTDASKKEDKVGIGIYRKRGGTKKFYAMKEHTTIFQAELTAILRCARMALEEVVDCGRCSDVYICTDSKAALLALDNMRVKSRVAKECIEALNHLGGYCNLHLWWVPGHSNVKGNIMADKLAKMGTRSRNVIESPGPSKGVIKSTIRDWLDKEHLKRWREQDGNRQAKMALGSELHPEWAKEFELMSRRDARLIVSLLTGHVRLNFHLSKMGLVASPSCRWCDAHPEEALHVLCLCSGLSERRRGVCGASTFDPSQLRKMKLSEIIRMWKGIVPAEVEIY